MTVNDTGVRRVGPTEAAQVTEVLATAFMDDPVSRWLFPDAVVREKLHPPFFRVFVDMVLADGEIHTVGDFDGVALWLSHEPDAQAAGEEDLNAVFEAVVGAEYAARFGVLGELMDANHPHDPHAYLPFIAVRPERQSSGVGSRLLEHRLRDLDAAGRAAYLESSSPRNQALYERHGFMPMEISLDLPVGPSLQPMWRKPS